MDEKDMSVREWQAAYRAGEFDSKDVNVQIKAGWHDWWCRDDALAGHLKKIAPVVLGITEPAILDHFRVWFKNNCPLGGPLYDDARFEPLEGDRDGRYFMVTLDSPHEDLKWTMYSERHEDLEKPEFACGNVREMCRHINEAAKELAAGLPEHSADPVQQESEYKQASGQERKPRTRKRTPKKKGQER